MSSESSTFDWRFVAFGYVYLTAQNILSTLIGVLGYSFLTRSISQVDVGVVAGLTLLSSFFQLLSDFGLNQSLAKFVSELKGRGEGSSSHLFSAMVFRVALASFLSLLLFLFPEGFSLLLFKTSSYSPLVRILSLDVLLLSVLPLLSSFLLGAGRLREIVCYGLASTLVRWVSIIVFLLQGFGVPGVVLGWILGDSLGVAAYSISVLRSGALGSMVFNLKGTLAKLLRFSFPLYLASVVSFLYSYYDRVVVLAFLPLSDVGVYDVAYRVFSVLVAFTAPFSSALFPYYGSAYGRNDHESMSSAVTRASKYSALIFSPLALGLFATSRPVITLFAGQQYEDGYVVLSILCLFALVYSVSPAFSNLLLIYGKTGTILLLSLLPVAVSLLALPLLQFLGLNGLALMKGFSMLVSFTLSLHVLSRVMRIRLDRPALLKTFSSSTMMALIVMVVEQLYYSKFLLPFYVVLGGIVYMFFLRLLKVLGEEDLAFLQQVFGGKIGLVVRKVLY
jgi:O-antigen/teichoic acid export membrane protein